MIRVLFLATLALFSQGAASGQATSILHIKVVLVDAERKATPVPRHALLISDNPSSAPPRRVLTGPDGTVDLALRPGNYTVESDRPVAFNGKAYGWAQIVDIHAGRAAVLELTADNAEVGAVTASATAVEAPEPLEADPSFLLPQWQDSVVALWTPSTHASGFLIDATGLIATNQRVVGTATSVEVQLAPAVKVAARVLVADALRDVAILWIDPKIAGAIKPLPLGCADASKPAVVGGQELVAIGAPLREAKGMATGNVSRVDPHSIVADFSLAPGSAGGPVFTVAGAVVGISSIVDNTDASGRGDFRVVRLDEACNVVAAAEAKMKGAAPPNGTHLPVEPARPFSAEVLKEAAKRRVGHLSPYQMSSSEFEIAFMTPVLIYGAREQAEKAGRERGTDPGRPIDEKPLVNPLTDFSNWSEYVADSPPVLLVRVTPKFVEGLWTKVARGAASTQGIALPPIKRFKPGLLRMRTFCGDVEVTPIHPFKLEQRLSESEAIYEGLYVFDPGALGPHCTSARLVLYSEKEPEKGDTRVIDPKVLQQIWDDFAPYRAGGGD